MFHTNSIEGQSFFKRISNNCSQINYLEVNGINIKDYLDGWICFCLFITEIEKKRFNFRLY